MSRKFKGVFIFIIAILMLQTGSLSAWGKARHFNLVLKPGWLPVPDSPDIMNISGTLTIDQQVRTGDEIGIFYNGVLCGAKLIANRDGGYFIYLFNSNAVINGPVTGSVLEVRLWDSQKKVEVEMTKDIQVAILDSEVKNAAGRLIWKWNEPNKPWRMDLNYLIDKNAIVQVPTVADWWEIALVAFFFIPLTIIASKLSKKSPNGPEIANLQQSAK